MALPQDGQDANGLTKVTQIPAGKELMFIDPTTNEGGIITLEDLTKQILNGLTTQAFKMDTGTQTIPAAINYLFGNSISRCIISYKDSEVDALGNVEACIKDAISKNKVPSNSAFYGNFIAGITYLMLGYRYYNGKYGTIILYAYNNTTIRASINKSVITIS